MVEVELEWSGEGTQVHVSGEFTDWQPRQPVLELLAHFQDFFERISQILSGKSGKISAADFMSSGIINKNFVTVTS
jgi:hypothetical protein